MNRTVVIIIVGILLAIGLVITMGSWNSTMTGPDNTPSTAKEVPQPPK